VVIAKGAALLHAVWFPTVLMFSTVLLALKTYFVCLASYWSVPSVRIASIALSSVVIGVILSVLTGSIAAANVARVIQQNPVGTYLKGMEARVFAAALRFLAIAAVGVALIGMLSVFARQRLGPELSDYVAWSGWVAAILFITVLSARCGFLAPALAATERRSVLRRGWMLSGAHLWAIIVAWLMLTVAPAALLQGVGEYLVMRLADASVMTLAQGAERFATDNLALLLIACSLVLTAVASTVLTTIGSFAVVESLTDR
jgi:hypothetical protein